MGMASKVLQISIKSDDRTYNVLITAWCANKNLREARKIIGMMNPSGLLRLPDVVSYNALAKAYARSGQAQCTVGKSRKQSS
ncbi:hypothetical protein SUGI_0942610 [Cryptomeria japonica]|nr:hypothetical protein SUGI_0942610 [Cryptomeria japonica]